MLLHNNKVRERKALARIIRTIGVPISSKGLKDSLLIFQRNPATIMLNSHPQILVELSDFNINFRAVVQVFNLTKGIARMAEQA